MNVGVEGRFKKGGYGVVRPPIAAKPTHPQGGSNASLFWGGSPERGWGCEPLGGARGILIFAQRGNNTISCIVDELGLILSQAGFLCFQGVTEVLGHQNVRSKAIAQFCKGGS